jgi:type 1 glutamine amidotransferase
MKSFLISMLTMILTLTGISAADTVRVLVITGGHSYNTEEFNRMMSALDPGRIMFQVSEFPEAYEMFLPENRNKYDVFVFYHMWQTITEDQKRIFADCIREGKPVVVLHHSICAYDDWHEYWDIIGGKYFHKATLLNGKEYPPCSYIHDLHFRVRNVNPGHPVTKDVADFDIFDETYKGFYVKDDVIPLLETDEPSSTRTIGWTKEYGKARIVVLQSGHDVPTFKNHSFRTLLKQAIEWVSS